MADNEVDPPVDGGVGDSATDVDNDDNDNDDATSTDVSVNTVEPEYDKANSISFGMICHRMEQLWALKRKKQKQPDKEKKLYLLPPKLLKNMLPQSIFPLFRLLMPDIDNSRNAAMKEKLIAQAYCDVEGFAKGTTNYQMLYGYTDPQKVPHLMAGDLSLVVQHIMSKRVPNKRSELTLGQMNSLLDDLATIAQRRRSTHNHEWRNSNNNKSQSQQSPSNNNNNNNNNTKKPKKESNASLREQWLRRVMAKRLSPLEHKWLVRILLQKMEFGLGWRAILGWYNPYALELWNSHNSLKNLCDKLADPEYTKARKDEQTRKQALQDSAGVPSRWEPQDQPTALGNTISPMLSTRVFFSDCMTKLEWNHSEYRKLAYTSTTTPPPLSVRFPAICAEIKLDGERMIAHVNQGQVTMQTRNGKWYSQLYSPVLGPAIRKAISKYKVNVILDGEVEAWDNGRQEVIPFGNNRTVAKARRYHLQKRGLLESIDQKLHASTDGSIADPNIMQLSDDLRFVNHKLQDEPEDSDRDIGKDCWLQFLIFDILYVDGPDAIQLFKDCLVYDEAIQPGSLIHLTLLQRKIILHKLIEEQEKEVEIGKAVIIRPNGDCVKANQYFDVDNPLMDGQNPGALLDSTQTAIQDCLPQNIQDIDLERRKGRSDIEISQARAKEVEAFYTTVVEQHKMEGLVLKDLAAPYILGQASRSRKFWHKFKPDYEDGVSIDVVILGAFFASGLRHSGRLSHFLCGVVDETDPSAFMPMLSVNGKSVSYEKLDKIMELTGYFAATSEEPVQMGKWFEADVKNETIPDFISRRSYQRDMKEDHDGWTCSKKVYPDLWVDPEFSIVLELKGQEFVRTKEFSTGLTMRFPRIKYIRHEAIDGGTKSVFDADTHRNLFEFFYDALRQRQEFAATLNGSSFSPSGSGGQIHGSRFVTPEEYARKPKKRRLQKVSPSRIPKVEEAQTQALKKITFTVLEGNYSLDPQSLEAEDARDNGWLKEAMKVRRKEDIMKFVLLHGGKLNVSADSSPSMIVGGKKTDPRVVNFIKGIEYAKANVSDKPKTKRALQLQNMAEREGVLKWTYLYSIVHRWLASQEYTANDSIAGTCEWLLVPKAHDFLAKSSAHATALNDIFDLERSEDNTKIELLRALEEMPSTAIVAGKHPFTWQYDGREVVPPKNSLLQVNGSTEERNQGMGWKSCIVVYPHVFKRGYGIDREDEALEDILTHGTSSKRWSEGLVGSAHRILSVLPLAAAMGGIVSPHLYDGVTHVVVELEGGAPLKAGVANLESFQNQGSASSLLERVEQVQAPVHFVTPAWIRSRWQQVVNQT